jgi:hypothetical protein
MNKFLLPYQWKLAGIVLAVTGTISAILYLLFDFKYKMTVFAVYSSFLETKTFASFRTNVADEIILIILLAGLSLIVFSKEKNECEEMDALRLSAFFRALILNNLFLLFSILFIFGTGFIAMLVLNLFSFLILYLVFFYIKLRKLKV